MRLAMFILLIAIPLLTCSYNASAQMAAPSSVDSFPITEVADSVGNASPKPTIISPIRYLKSNQLHNSFNEMHNGHRHEAIDIMEPAWTPVHAVVSGTIGKLFSSKAGGSTIYEFDNRRVYCYYYAHLEGYAAQLREGMHVHAGEVIGYVGTTGNASPGAPHLHFAIHLLEPQKRWWSGSPIDPYPVLERSLYASPRPSIEGIYIILEMLSAGSSAS